MKVNFDVAVPSSSSIGMVFVARDHHGRVLASGATKNPTTLSISIVEVLAFRWTMRVVVEMDGI